MAKCLVETVPLGRPGTKTLRAPFWPIGTQDCPFIAIISRRTCSKYQHNITQHHPLSLAAAGRSFAIGHLLHPAKLGTSPAENEAQNSKIDESNHNKVRSVH
jgi:hypothetical protein